MLLIHFFFVLVAATLAAASFHIKKLNSLSFIIYYYTLCLCLVGFIYSYGGDGDIDELLNDDKCCYISSSA